MRKSIYTILIAIGVLGGTVVEVFRRGGISQKRAKSARTVSLFQIFSLSDTITYHLNVADHLERHAGRICYLIIRYYPKHKRDEFGEEMACIMRLDCRDAYETGGFSAYLLYLLWSTVDLIWDIGIARIQLYILKNLSHVPIAGDKKEF